jgi:hypothetical protein
MLAPIHEACSIDFVEIIPKNKFTFPWTQHVFFDCMPETVLQIPEELEPMEIPNKNYDLVILGYQPWFLSPSIPFNSFLQSKYAECLKGKNVLTVIGSRNMWLNAQEKTKAKLHELKSTLVGNIVFIDKNPNLVSILTVIRWSFKGQKEASGMLPEAGVSNKDIAESARFGSCIYNNIQSPENLHQELLKLGSIDLEPGLIILEKRGITNFRKFAPFIREKGGRGDLNRLPRVKLFNRLLLIGVFILSPISSLTAKLAVIFNKKNLLKEVEYFKSTDYKENAI